MSNDDEQSSATTTTTRNKDDEFQCEIDFTQITDYDPRAWLVRPCEWYMQEYKDCKSIRARVHQYFIAGKTANCDQWRDDYYNCATFRKTKDLLLVNRIIESELSRKAARIAAVNANDVWEYRSQPPDDWNRPVKSRHDLPS